MGILLCKDGKVERLPSLSAALGAGSPGSVPGPATGPSAFVQGAVPSLDPRPEPPSKLKPRWSLVPMEPLGEVAWLLTLGALEYPDEGWKSRPWDSHLDAAWRHLAAWQSGSRVDRESGLSHLTHALCRLLFLRWQERNGVAP